MLSPMPIASADAQRLAEILKQLSEQDRKTLFDFADYLAQRGSAAQESIAREPQKPLGHKRPAQESVIAAIKRLRDNYPMVDPDKLLHQTADLMQSHMVSGRAAEEVIDDLEALFSEQFDEYMHSFSES